MHEGRGGGKVEGLSYGGQQDGPSHHNHSLPAVLSVPVVLPLLAFFFFLSSSCQGHKARVSAERRMVGVNGVRWQTPG